MNLGHMYNVSIVEERCVTMKEYYKMPTNIFIGNTEEVAALGGLLSSLVVCVHSAPSPPTECRFP